MILTPLRDAKVAEKATSNPSRGIAKVVTIVFVKISSEAILIFGNRRIQTHSVNASPKRTAQRNNVPHLVFKIFAGASCSSFPSSVMLAAASKPSNSLLLTASGRACLSGSLSTLPFNSTPLL